MKRLLPAIPFLGAFFIVMLLAVNLSTSKRFPIYSPDGGTVLASDTQCSEPKILPPVSGNTPLSNNYQLIDLRDLCLQALPSSAKNPVPGDLRIAPQPVTPDSLPPSPTEEIIWSSVTLSNKKDRIAFYSNTSLYIVNLRTRQSVHLYTLPANSNLSFYDAITWSPEDSYLTFGHVSKMEVTASNRQYALGLINPVSGEAKIIHYSLRPPQKPVWSPDGQYLAAENPVIIYEVKKGNLIRVASGNDTHNPQWSPDGKHIVFTQHSSPTRGETFRYSLETREILQITSFGKTVSPVDWLKSPSTILFETENNLSDIDSGRHHVGEVRPHSESSIRWLSPFDRFESNRFLSISPNERYVVLQRTEPLKSSNNQEHALELIAVNRELSFFSWRCAKIHSFAETPRMTYTWTRDGKLLLLGDRQSGRIERNRKWELFLIDLDHLTEQKIWETRSPTRLIGMDGNLIYYTSF